MRFLHTADWHLGRLFHGTSLLEDQAHVLEQFLDLARTSDVDAVVIAGDVYDRAVPPADAVALLSHVLEELVAGARIPVVLIAGNHDSAERIQFGSRIAERHGLHVRGGLDRLEPVLLSSRTANVAFHPMPYAEPAQVRQLPDAQDVEDHAQAMALLASRLRAAMPADHRHVLVAHAFVAGSAESESERPLSVGNAGVVPASTFSGFDYVALGHLHRPQRAGADHIRYSGSLLKYSFHEADHSKSVTLVELDGSGPARVSEHALRPRRDVRVIKGQFHDLLAAPPDASCQDYISAHLTDAGPVLDPLARLREVYPNVMEVRFLRNEDTPGSLARSVPSIKHDPAQLFEAFWLDMQGHALDAARRAALVQVTQDAMRQDREAA